MFLNYDIKNYYLLSVISFIFDILRRITTFSERHSVFFRGGTKVTSFLIFKVLGSVVQSIVSLTSSLRGQLVKCFMTL